MTLLLKAHLTDGTVLRCDEECHDSTDYGRPCICFNRFHGIGYDAARDAMPASIHYITMNLIATVPNLRVLELHLTVCDSLEKPLTSCGAILRAILFRKRSTPPADPEPSGFSTPRP